VTLVTSVAKAFVYSVNTSQAIPNDWSCNMFKSCVKEVQKLDLYCMQGS